MERWARSRNVFSHVSAVNWITSSGREEGGREEKRRGSQEEDKGQSGAGMGCGCLCESDATDLIMTSVDTAMM